MTSALQPLRLLEITTATFTNNSATVQVTGNVDCSRVYAGSVVSANGFRNVEGVSGTIPDNSGNSTITLRSPWPFSTTTTSALVSNTPEGLVETTRIASEVVRQSSAIENLGTNGLVNKTGATTYETVTITPQAVSLLDDATAADMRTTIGALGAGDFGIGSDAPSFDNWQSIPITFGGFAQVNAGASNRPTGIPDDFYLLTMSGRNNDTAIVQSLTNFRVYKIRRVGGSATWEFDSEFLTTGNSVNPLDFGIGAQGASITGDDANNLIDGGIYRATSSTSNTAVAGTFCIIVSRSFNVVGQIQTDGNRTWIRRSTDSGANWQPWRELYHSGNTNFNEWGRLGAGRTLAVGVANNTTVARIPLYINSQSSPTSISFTAASDFELRTVAGGVIGTVTDLSLLSVSSERVAYLQVTVSGASMTSGDLVEFRNLNTNGLTVNF